MRRADAARRCQLPLARAAAQMREYVIGDMISPFKAVLGGDYKAVQKIEPPPRQHALPDPGRRLVHG